MLKNVFRRAVAMFLAVSVITLTVPVGASENYELNSEKENSIRFWKAMGFVENGKDEEDMLLLIKR